MASIFKSLKAKMIRGKVAKVIYRSELSARSMGVSSMELIQGYAEELKEEKSVAASLYQLVRKMQSGKNKDVVYKDILDPDIIVLLKESRIKQIPSDSIFRDYVPLKEIGERTAASIRKKLYIPFVIFTLLVLGLNTTMKSFLEIAEYGVAKFSSMQLTMMEYFVELNFLIGGVFAFFLLVMPTKTPMIKGVFTKIRGMLALSTIRTMSQMGYSSGVMLVTLKKQFGSTKTKKKNKRFKDEVSALIDFLKAEKMIDLMQSAEIKMGAERGELQESVSTILEEKLLEVSDLREMVDSVIGTLAMLLLTPPVFMIVGVLTSLMSGAGG